jgi:hypothetical protein
MSKQKVQVVMLPEDTIGYPSDMWQLGEYQHLYFTTDEPIQEGDWIFEQGEWGIKSVCQSIGNWTKENHLKYPNDKKIVASTNPALGLPAISTTWINDVYIPSNGSIKEVELETYRHVENVEVVNGVAPVYSDRLRLINNEVVIVDGAMEVFEKVVDGYVSHEEGLNQLKQMETEQELEDAAKVHRKYLDDNGWQVLPSLYSGTDLVDTFKAGAEWQKEQSAKHAIEFANWILGEASHEWNKRASLPLEEAHKQLYELWQKNQKKSTMP